MQFPSRFNCDWEISIDISAHFSCMQMSCDSALASLESQLRGFATDLAAVGESVRGMHETSSENAVRLRTREGDLWDMIDAQT